MKRTAFSPHEELYIQYLQTSEKHNMTIQHYHDTYEVYLQLEGKRYLFYDNICYLLQKGDMVIFKPFAIHYAQSREADYYARYVMNVKMENLSLLLDKGEIRLLKEKIHSGVVHLTEKQTEEMYDYFKRAEALSEQKGFLAEKLLYSSVLQLIMAAVKYMDSKNEAGEETIPPQIIRALTYIKEHYREEISLDEISAAANMSKYHFCRSFKNVTGATALEYLNNVRLTKVHNLLLDTRLSIDEISKETGFGCGINLTRVFKKVYGISPREFRKQKVNGVIQNK